jgi:hypothetical protein
MDTASNSFVAAVLLRESRYLESRMSIRRSGYGSTMICPYIQGCGVQM